MNYMNYGKSRDLSVIWEFRKYRPQNLTIHNEYHETIVTGGAGFLGSHLCDFLLERGHEVICIDNLVTGKTSSTSAQIDLPT
jgi:hypothetical protein